MSVSRETTLKFERYLALLHKWQKTINLVGKDTIDDAMRRHVEDSLQLLALVPDQVKTIVDWGSGAGFPGLVMAMASPRHNIHLVEADQRKAAFLRTVSRETDTPVTIHDGRLEALLPVEIAPDAVTARAFAPLKQLLSYAEPWLELNPDLSFLLLKGRSYREEIAEAQQIFDFEVRATPSKTEEAAVILAIQSVRRI